MTQKITTYYIPQNLNIKQGKIYNLYLNKITNLDLTSIIKTQNEKNNTITISIDTYNSIISLLEKINNIYSQTKELSPKITNRR